VLLRRNKENYHFMISLANPFAGKEGKALAMHFQA